MTTKETTELRYRRLRAAIAHIDPVTVKGVVRGGNPTLVSQLHPALRTALGRLRSAKDPAAMLDLPHFQPALEYVGQAVTLDCLEATRQALGDSADHPTAGQLRAAVEEISERYATEVIAVLLALTAAIDAPAAPACDEILGDDPAYGLREEDLGPTESPTPQPTQPAQPARPTQPARSAQTAEPVQPTVSARSARDRKRTRKSGPAAQAHQPWKKAKPAASDRPQETASEPASDLPRPVPPEVAPSGGRRPAHLTAGQASRFDTRDDWVGAVVLAEIPYGPSEDEHAHFGSKDRPCVVIAGNAAALLVRPGYTGRFQRDDWRSVPIRGWHRAGLDRQTWIDAEVHEVKRDSVSFLGRLNDTDWNALW